jgi:uncharacterized membrane protein
MDWLTLTLRLAHVMGGAIWVGMMVFNVFFLGPAFAEAGPAGAAVGAALQRRRVMTVTPIIALLTIFSGIGLMERVYGGMGALAASRMGMALNLGAVVTLVAFLIGIIVMRPIMMRATLTTDPAEAQRLRVRGAVLGRVVTYMLLFALAAMAVARYL